MLRDEAASVDQGEAVGTVELITGGITGEDDLNEMRALIGGTMNPDAFGLINRGRNHDEPLSDVLVVGVALQTRTMGKG